MSDTEQSIQEPAVSEVVINIEAGDGGVSGLPFSIEPSTFYSELWRRSA
jgi:hypothetical protein